jgi:hypothetical protein
MLSDTSAEAARLQIELLRQAGPERRLQMAMNLSATVIGMSRMGMAKRWPELSEHERGLKFVEFVYGRDLAANVRQALERRHACRSI